MRGARPLKSSELVAVFRYGLNCIFKSSELVAVIGWYGQYLVKYVHPNQANKP